MKLSEALSVIQRAPVDAPPLPVLLACGFTPLHLENYLAAHLQSVLPHRKVRISTGLYDDLAGTLEHFEPAGSHAVAIVIEWSDLDPRLGYRKLGGWGQRVAANILKTVETALGRLQLAISKIPASVKVALALPGLPFTPAFHTSGWQASGAEIALWELMAGFARRLVSHPSVLLLNEQRLNELSRPDERYDLRADLHAGFPYTLKHADALGGALAALIASPQPKKGLITDLDDTLWLGLVGEEAYDGVAWDLQSHVGADSVVFVDDNRMEIEEVRSVFPDMECTLFPRSDYAAGLTMLRRLRDLFGKPQLAEEDAYRLETIKQNRHLVESSRNGDLAEHFPATAGASIDLEFNPSATDKRVVELVNKTNQFNLNGLRYTEAEWQQGLENPDCFVAVVSYRDKLGLLGKIAVLREQRTAERVQVDTWVMSCKAFSRRIEYQCLAQLFQRFEAQKITFHFMPTPKNEPMRVLLSSLVGEPGLALTRETFTAQCPKLDQEVARIVDTIEQVR